MQISLAFSILFKSDKLKIFVGHGMCAFVSTARCLFVKVVLTIIKGEIAASEVCVLGEDGRGK